MMQLFFIRILFFHTLLLFSQERKTNQPLSQKTVELSEVVVKYETLYDVYKKAAHNLKKKLIKNRNITYYAEGIEHEDIGGDKRTLNSLFTARLEKANPSKKISTIHSICQI